MQAKRMRAVLVKSESLVCKIIGVKTLLIDNIIGAAQGNLFFKKI